MVRTGLLASPSIESLTAEQRENVDGLHVQTLGSLNVQGVEDFPEELAESARRYFEIAAEGGDGVALEWLNKMPVPDDPSESQQGAEENSLDQTDSDHLPKR
jgi:hypothetical protein